MAYCENCGAQLAPGTAFCTNCGHKVTAANAQQPANPAQQQNYHTVPSPGGNNGNSNNNADKPKKKKKSKLWLILLIIFLVLAFIVGGLVAAFTLGLFDGLFGSHGEATLTEFSADEYYFLNGKESTVTFTVKAEGDFDKIELYCGEKLAAEMNDNGENGDVTGGDGIYACTVNKTVNSTSRVVDTYCAKASESQSENLNIYYFTVDDIRNASDYITMAEENIKGIEGNFNIDGSEEGRTQSAKEVYDEIIKYFDQLVEEEKVIAYTTEENTITAVFNGVVYVYTFDLNQDAQNNITFVNNPSSGTAADSEDAVASSVVTIQPYAYELSSPVFDDAAKEVGELYGYDFSDNIDNSRVTIDFLKTLDQYDVIIWDGHGGYTSTLHSFVGTGESSDNAYLYPEQVIGSRPAILTLEGGVLGVTAKFFNEVYDEGDFDDAVVFMGGCCTANDDVLANAFIDNGAAAYYGYRNSVYTEYNRKMTESLFDALTDTESSTTGTKTVTAALNEAKTENGAQDNTVNRNWWYKFKVFMGWVKDEDPAVLTLYTGEGDENHRLLTPSGILAGKVCKASDRATPVSGAQINIYSGSTLKKTLKSDSNGDYKVNLPVGDYRLVINADGYIEFVCYATVTTFNVTYTETFLLIVGGEVNEGTATGSIKHALTGEFEAGVKLSVFKNWNNQSGTGEVASTVTNEEGGYSFKLPLGNYTVKASKDGFVDCYFNIIVQIGTTDNQNGTITPTVAGNSFLITLTWDDAPEDLDSHVSGKLSDGSSFHVDYHYSEHQDYETAYTVLDPPKDGDIVVCRLDCDDIESYGPEHVTLQTTTSSPYYYYVKNYSGDSSLVYSGARVTIHQGNNLIADFHVPTNNGSGDYWNVFAIKDGEIIVNNTITSSPNESYAN